MRSDDLYLAEILDAADLIARRIRDIDVVSWNADDEKRDAVLFRLMTIGEAARSLSPNRCDSGANPHCTRSWSGPAMRRRTARTSRGWRRPSTSKRRSTPGC